MSQEITTHMHWVPGHVQVRGNEKGDALAKNGTKGKGLLRDATTSITDLKVKKGKKKTTFNREIPLFEGGENLGSIFAAAQAQMEAEPSSSMTANPSE